MESWLPDEIPLLSSAFTLTSHANHAHDCSMFSFSCLYFISFHSIQLLQKDRCIKNRTNKLLNKTAPSYNRNTYISYVPGSFFILLQILFKQQNKNQIGANTWTSCPTQDMLCCLFLRSFYDEPSTFNIQAINTTEAKKNKSQSTSSPSRPRLTIEFEYRRSFCFMGFSYSFVVFSFLRMQYCNLPSSLCIVYNSSFF